MVQNSTSNSQRTLVTPPRGESEFSREPIIGNRIEAGQYREHRLAWADQIIQNHSMDSRLPAPNNLQAEIERASRVNFSADGFQLPFRAVQNTTSQETPYGSAWLPAPPNTSRFCEPVASATRYSTGNPLNGGNFPGLQTVTTSTVNLLPELVSTSLEGDLRPILNSTVQPNLSEAAAWPSAAISSEVIEDSSRMLNPFLSEFDASAQPTPPRRHSQPCPQGNQSSFQPENETQFSNNFVHVSEIQNYVETYVRQLLANPSQGRPTFHDVDVDRLAQQMEDVGIQNVDVTRRSHSSSAPQGRPTLSPPLQRQATGLSGNVSENREESRNENTPFAFRQVLRNSFPSFQNPVYPGRPTAIQGQGQRHAP